MKEHIHKILKVSELNTELKKILLSKQLNNEDLMYASDRSYELINLTDGLDARAYIFLGKIKHYSKKYKEAINAFKIASKINPILPSSYYGLFKVYMDSNKYDLALENILLFQKYSQIDCSIYISLLNKILNNHSSYVNYNESILGNKKLPENILTNYSLAVKNINEENYSKALKHINICQKLLSSKNIKIDLRYLVNILIKLIEITNDKERKENINILSEIILTSNNCGQKYLAIKQLNDIVPNNLNILLLSIDICIELSDMDQALEYLDRAKLINPNFPKVKYYEQLINDLGYTSTNYMDKVMSCFKIDTLVVENDIDSALDLSTSMLEETKDPIYIYKSATILFRLKRYEEAKQLFSKYLSLDTLYQKESYYYLFYINEFNGNTSLSNYYLSATYEISNFEGVDISIESWKNILLRYIDIFDNKTIKNIENDLLKSMLIEKTKMKVKGMM